jgi:ubiquinone biosynthesis protein UbiJ
MTGALPLAAAIETALDLYVNRDAQALARCSELEGKVIRFDVTVPAVTLYFLPHGDGIQVLSHFEGEVHTHLQGTALALARTTLGSREDTVFSGDLQISGDTETAQRFQDILTSVDWDWEEQLSMFTGDVIAHRLGTLARQTGHFLGDAGATLTQNMGEYLQEEARLVPTRLEIESFLAQVDQLRSDTDRLAARVDRLLRAMDDAP